MGCKQSTNIVRPLPTTSVFVSSTSTLSSSLMSDIFGIMWLDHNHDKLLLDRFNQILSPSSPKTFSKSAICVDYCISSKDKKLFLIVSGSFGENIIQLIHDLPQIVAVYIYCCNKQLYEKWATNFNKVRGVFTDEQLLITKLEKDIWSTEKDLTSMSAFNGSNAETSSRDIDKEQARFMWSTLILEVILRLPDEVEAKKDMLKECRLYYKDNRTEQVLIDEFEKVYERDKTIWWYTRECFLYRLVNKALRTQDIDIIFKFRFFIRELHNQLKERHSKYVQSLPSDATNTLDVYRGQGMITKELKLLQNRIGGFITMNSFLSTSTGKDVAYSFAQDALDRGCEQGVLFHIQIDMNKNTNAFLDVAHLSAIPSENEILFTMGTIFGIASIEVTSDNVTIISLTLGEKEENRLAEVRSFLKERNLESETRYITLCDFLTMMGDYNKAKVYFDLTRNTMVLNNYELPYAYEIFGKIHFGLGDYSSALRSFETALDCLMASPKTNKPVLGYIYGRIADVHRKQENYTQALEYAQKALQSDLSITDIENIYLASDHLNVGRCYSSVGDSTSALENYEKALEILMASPCINFTMVSDTYLNIAEVYLQLEKFEESMLYYEKSACAFETAMVPNNHSWAAELFKFKSKLLFYQGKYQEALQYALKAKLIISESFDDDHPNLGFIYRLIADIEIRLGNKEASSLNMQKSSEIYSNYLSKDHSSLLYASTIHSLHQNELGEEVLNQCEKILASQLSTLPSNHPRLAHTYYTTGVAYLRSEKCQLAEKCFQDALDAQYTILSSNHTELGQTYEMLGLCKATQNHIDLALFYYRKAEEIYLSCTANIIRLEKLLLLYSNVGYSYWAFAKDQVSAKIYYRKALNVFADYIELSVPILGDIYFKMASVCNCLSDSKQAILYYTKSLETYPEDLSKPNDKVANIYQMLGVSYVKINDERQALYHFEKAREFLSVLIWGPMCYTVYRALGLLYEKKEEFGKAVEVFDILCRHLPSNIELVDNVDELFHVYFIMVKCHRALKNNTLALACLDKALHLWQTSPSSSNKEYLIRIYIAYGELYRTNDTSRGLEYYNKALTICLESPKSDNMLTAVCYKQLGIMYSALGDNDLAYTNFQTAVEVYKNHCPQQTVDLIAIYHSMGQIQMGKKNIDAALEMFNNMLELNPSGYDLVICYFKIGFCNQIKKYYELAITNYEKASEVALLSAEPKALELLITVYFSIASCFYSMPNEDNYRKTLRISHTALDYALKYNSDLVPHIYRKYIIDCHSRLNEFNDVLTNLKKMIDIYLVDQSRYPISDIAWVYDNMGYIYSEKTNQPDLALDNYKKAFEICSADASGFIEDKKRLLCNIALLYKQKEDYNAAIEYYEKALTLSPPDHPSISLILTSLGSVSIKKGEYKKALIYYRRILETFSHLVTEDELCYTHWDISLCYSHENEFDNAHLHCEIALEKALRLINNNDPNTVSLYVGIGRSHFLLQEHEKAMRYYTQALNLSFNKQPLDYIAINNIYEKIAVDGKNGKKYSLAIEYFEKQIENYPNYLSDSILKSSYATTYYNIALVYEIEQNWLMCINYYEKALVYFNDTDQHSKITECKEKIYSIKTDHLSKLTDTF